MIIKYHKSFLYIPLVLTQLFHEFSILHHRTYLMNAIKSHLVSRNRIPVKKWMEF